MQVKIYDIFEDPNTSINSSSIETVQNSVKSPSKLAYYTSKDSTLNGFVGLLPNSNNTLTQHDCLCQDSPNSSQLLWQLQTKKAIHTIHHKITLNGWNGSKSSKSSLLPCGGTNTMLAVIKKGKNVSRYMYIA